MTILFYTYNPTYIFFTIIIVSNEFPEEKLITVKQYKLLTDISHTIKA